MADPEIPTEVPTKFPPAKIPTTSPAYKAGGGNLGWEESRKCEACGVPCSSRPALCGDCWHERVAHRKSKAVMRWQALKDRLDGEQ